MTYNLTSLGRTSKPLCCSLLVGACLAMASPGLAQWPTDYLEPKILGGGTETRAAAVMATAAGGAIVAFDDISGGVRQATARHFNIAGDQLLTNIDLRQSTQFAISLQLLGSASSTIAFKLLAHYAKPDLDDTSAYTTILEYIDPTGQWISIAPSTTQFLQGVIPMEGGVAASVRLIPGDAKIDYRIGGIGSTLLYTSGDQVLNPQLVKLGSGSAMATWIAERDGENFLSAKVVDADGYEISGAKDAVTDVTDYIAIPTTLGLPVFAAIQQDATVYPPVNTLIGGLINPTNGGTVTISIASGTGVKLKALQQDINGDFSLAYSVVEDGTSLLKVRRISGVSAATLWETTVADLGLATDEVIARHPNTWISEGVGGALYILARYDQPGTANSSFQLVRLRADGTMGAIR